MNKTAIKNFAVWARNKLIADITYKAGLIGVSESGIAQPLPQSTKDLQFFDIGTREYAQVAGKDIEQRNNLIKAIQARQQDGEHAAAFKAIVEEIAYTWFNRLIAIRFMEVNDYLPSRVRVLSSENAAKDEPDFVTNPFDTDLEFTQAEQDHVMKLKDENQLDALFRMLFIKQCNKLYEILPELFEKTNDYTELLLNISFTDKDGVVYHLVHDIEERDFDITTQDEEGKTPGQVEIIGWLYQYYNIEPKDETFALLKKNVKITKERIPAATQLFTPDWIVRYMVENSLGRLWVEGHPNDSLKENWKYYLEEAEQEPEVEAQLREIRETYQKMTPEDIRIIDPCMGSGHILVYAFDVLMQIYESQGYTQRDAAQAILEHNLYGLDIDKRAAQLAYFAVMMKGRQYDRRIFRRGIRPHIYAIEESNGINRSQLTSFGKGLSDLERNLAVGEITELLDTLTDAKEYGSILNVEDYHWDLLRRFAADTDASGQMSLETMGIEDTQERLLQLIQLGQVMGQKYDVVVTNPPYMGASGMNPKLSQFIKKHYADYKSDFFSAFVVKCSKMAKAEGYLGFFTPYVWMFIQSYEKMRNYLYHNTTIETLIQFEYSAFEEATVPVCTFVFKNSNVQNKKGCYFRLTDFRGGMEVQRKKTLEAIANHDCGYYFEQSTENFSKIPGSPVAYWVSENFFELFNHQTLKEYTFSDGQNKTGDNDKYLRLFWEVNNYTIGKNRKWIQLAKGGGFRRWYGNITNVIDWDDAARAHYKEDYVCRIIPDYIWYKEGITWGDITSYKPSFRVLPEGMTFETAGLTIFPTDASLQDYIIGLLNSCVFGKVAETLNSTFHTKIKDVQAMPVVIAYRNVVKEIVQKTILLSKADWDSFETSWDFKRHPLLDYMYEAERPAVVVKFDGRDTYLNVDTEVYTSIEDAFVRWNDVCNARFVQLKANEEELNRIFIDIYGLQDELTPEVEDKDVTVRKADVGRDVRSLLSYAVGCMFGRYSLDVDGLAYAGGEWDSSKYTTFIPDKDNCIPITDEAYFEDDIVGLLCQWLEVVYGSETLEENLAFIAKALGNKGTTSREIIRNYFLTDFIKEHIKIYQKRPIYWLFDSGKKHGFKALVYMHRWNADTAGNLRVEYLHKTQHIYEREIQRMQETMDTSKDAREVSRAAKRKDKLQKQLKETQEYDTRLAHIALSRIDIDLDDGVKVNYEKVQTSRTGEKLQILAKL